MSSEKQPQETALKEQDLQWINQHLNIYQEMLAYYFDQPVENKFDPKTIDDLFVVLLKEIESGEVANEMVANTIGCAMGHGLSKQLGFKWIIYTDEYGTELAAKNDNNNWIAFPLNSVWKRIESKETGFVRSIFDSFGQI